jgi:hypothetical protein
MATKLMSAAATAASADPKQSPPEFAQCLRDTSLAAMGQQVDRYIRSPQFLAMMKQSLDAQIAFRKQLNQFFTDALHSVEGVARQDVDSLALSVRHVENRVLDRIEALCERLEEVSRRLDVLEPAKGRRDEREIADVSSMDLGME